MRNSCLFWCSALCFFLAAGCGGSSNNGDSGVDGGDPVCGDGMIEGDEQCDDGAANSDTAADACRLDCTSPICGDDVVDTGEECDSANQCKNCVSIAVCGDDVVGGSEECDGEDGCLPEGHIDGCTFERTAFRFKRLEVLDPTLHLLECSNGFLTGILNDILTATTQGDWPEAGGTRNQVGQEAQDGLIDLGFVFSFAPGAQEDGAQTKASFHVADCDSLGEPAPSPNPTPCSPTIASPPYNLSLDVTTQTTGTCLGPIDGTADNVVPAVEPGDSGCWVSNPVNFDFILGSVVTIPLAETQIAAEWDSNPASNIVNGLIRGFIDSKTADMLIPDIDLLQGASLKDVFAPAPECDTSDTGPNGDAGFWLYISFDAEIVPWKGGLMCGNGTVDDNRTAPDVPETCDTGIDSGAGQCSFDCDDGYDCSLDTPNAGDPCTPSCAHFPVNEDGAADIFGRSAQCLGLCGDGIVQDFVEQCDLASDTAPCDDPAVICNDDDSCTEDFFQLPFGRIQNVCTFCAAGGICTPNRCRHAAITEADDGSDGCCPPGSPAGDPNCS